MVYLNLLSLIGCAFLLGFQLDETQYDDKFGKLLSFIGVVANALCVISAVK